MASSVFSLLSPSFWKIVSMSHEWHHSWPLEEGNSIRGQWQGLIAQSFCVMKFYWCVKEINKASVHGILQARILEWVAFPFFRRSSQSWDRTQISCIAARFFTIWATREALVSMQMYGLTLKHSKTKTFFWLLLKKFTFSALWNFSELPNFSVSSAQ